MGLKTVVFQQLQLRQVSEEGSAECTSAVVVEVCSYPSMVWPRQGPPLFTPTTSPFHVVVSEPAMSYRLARVALQKRQQNNSEFQSANPSV
jgi:hypothetical protein